MNRGGSWNRGSRVVLGCDGHTPADAARGLREARVAFIGGFDSMIWIEDFSATAL